MAHAFRALALSGVVAGAVVFGPAAGAQEDAIEIPLDSVVRADEGSETELASVDVPPEIQGATCVADAQADNQSSVHPGNDLVIRSGDVEAVIPDVEEEPGKVSVTSGAVTLGETITVSLRMGVDEVFSGGMVVSIDCTQPPPAQDAGTEGDDGSTATDLPSESTGDTATDATTSDATEGATAGAEDGAVASAGADAATGTDTDVAGRSELAMTGPRDAGRATLMATLMLFGGAGLLALGRRIGITATRSGSDG